MRCLHVLLTAAFSIAAVTVFPDAMSGPPPERMGQSSRLTSVVISEIMYNPANRSDGLKTEFIELYNTLSTPEDMSGYQLSGDVHFTFPTGTILPGRTALVVAQKPEDLKAATGIANAFGPFEAEGSLPNDRGTVRLLHRSGAVFLEVPYDSHAPWPIAADGAGHSLVLARPSFGEADPRAWAASIVIGGSPGSLEPSDVDPATSVVINEFLAHTDDPELDYIELYNRGPQAIDLSGAVLTDDPATNKFLFPAQTGLAPGGFLSLNQRQLGFALNAQGETLLLKNAKQTRVLDAIRFGAQENGVATGRFPDGSDEFYRLQSKTPGTANARILTSFIVFNEIMYHPISGDSDDQYIELYNRGDTTMDVSGWMLQDGIQFTFPAQTAIAAGQYLVVARNAARMRTNYSNLSSQSLLGNFEGKLAGSGERVALSMPDLMIATNSAGVKTTNIIHIVVDEVTYQDGGRWGQWSDGGGSSLERVNPWSDGRLAPNWQDSDETRNAPWTMITATGRVDNGDVNPDQLQVLLQGAGECLIDDVEVLDANGVNHIANGTFEGNANGWTAEGTESGSSWESSEGFNSANSYHVRAIDRGDNQVNRIRVPLTTALNSGSTATIRAKVRWLKGQPSILFRIRGNWLEAAGEMNTGTKLGTPGSQNSRFAANAAPAVYDVRHTPVLPPADETVTVTARVSAPNGISAVRLHYRLDPATSHQSVSMRDDGTGGDALAGDGVFTGVIPAQSSGALVAFYVEAVDAAASSGAGTFPDNAPENEALVRFGEASPSGTFPVYRIWMTQRTLQTWTQRSKLNNTPLPVTFVLGKDRVIYAAKALYAGSPYIAPGYNTPTGTRCGYSISFPPDDKFLGNTDLVLDWPGGHGGESTALQEQMAYWLADHMDLPYSHRYTIRLHVNGVTDMQRGTVFEAVNQPAGDFLRAWHPNDSDGDFYKIDRAFEFSDGGSLTADPQPRLQNYTTVGGAKKTARYRWSWLKRSTEAINDYRNIFSLVDALNAASPEPYTSQTEALVDLEEWMGLLAFEHIIVNFDAYGHEIGKNMYAYKPNDGKWQLYAFDLDWLMLAAAGRRADYSASSAPLFNAEDPTMVRMFNHPPFRRAYFRAVKKAVEGPMQSSQCDPVMDAKYQALVANGVTLCDGNALTGPGVVKTWFSQRRTALLNQLNSISAPFTITSNSGGDFSTDSNTTAITGTAPIEVKTLRVNGVVYPVTWISVTTWSITVPLRTGENRLTIDAVNVDGQLLTGMSDEIVVQSQSSPVSPVGRVLISEIMASPAIPGAEFVELFNSSETAFDLSGWKLSGVDFTFPPGTVLIPGGYLVITKDTAAFLAAYGMNTPLAGQFDGKLNSTGETLTLTMPNSTGNEVSVVDAVSYSTQSPWPSAAPGSSLQLIDPVQDNYRVANWAVASSAPSGPPVVTWQHVVTTGTASSSRLYIYMTSVGEVQIDDLTLVAGETAGVGENFILNGDFEGAFPGPWNVSANLSNSSLSSQLHHSGNGSLHVVSSSAGSSQSTSIWQDIGPLVSNDTYTLSYWFLPSTNGSGLTIRLSGSGISSTPNIGLEEKPELLSTPGAANSIAKTLPSLPSVWINELAVHNVSGITDKVFIGESRSAQNRFFTCGSRAILNKRPRPPCTQRFLWRRRTAPSP